MTDDEDASFDSRSDISDGLLAEISRAAAPVVADGLGADFVDEECELGRELGEDHADDAPVEPLVALPGYFQIDPSNDLVPIFACWISKEDDTAFAISWVKQWKLCLPAGGFLHTHKSWTWAVFFRGPTHSFVCLPHAWLTHERLVRLNTAAGLPFIDTTYPIPGKLGVTIGALIDMKDQGVDPVICVVGKKELARRGRKRQPDSLTAWLGDDPHDARSLPKYAAILAPGEVNELYTYVVKKLRGGADEEIDYDPGMPAEIEGEEGGEGRPMPSVGPNSSTFFDQNTFVEEYAAIMSCSIAYRCAWLSQRLLLKQGDVYVVKKKANGWFLAPMGPLTSFFSVRMEAVVPDVRTGRTRRISIAKSIKAAIPTIWGITVDPAAPSLADGLLNVYMPFLYRSWDLSAPLNWEKLGYFLMQYTERFHRGVWTEAHMGLACFGYFLLHPNECMESMPIYKGTNGIGKTKLFNIFMKLVGDNSAKIYEKAAEVFDRFNFSDISVLLHMIDENQFAKLDYNQLKARITASSFTCEPKGKERFRVDVPRFYMLGCNGMDDINIDLEERRVLAFEGMRPDAKMLFVEYTAWRTYLHECLSDQELLISLASFLTRHLDLSVFANQKGVMFPTAELHRMRVRALSAPQRTWVHCCKMGLNHCGKVDKQEERLSGNWLTRINLSEFNQLVYGYSHASRDLDWIKEYGLALGNLCVLVPPLSEARKFVAAKIRGWTANDDLVRQTIFMSRAEIMASDNALLIDALQTFKITSRHPALFLHFDVGQSLTGVIERRRLQAYQQTLTKDYPLDDEAEPEEQSAAAPALVAEGSEPAAEAEPEVRKRAREVLPPAKPPKPVTKTAPKLAPLFSPIHRSQLPGVPRVYHIDNPLPLLPDSWSPSPSPPRASPDVPLRRRLSRSLDIRPSTPPSFFTGIDLTAPSSPSSPVLFPLSTPPEVPDDDDFF